MSDFTPKTRLQKILCGVTTTAKTRLEKSAKCAVDNAGSGGGGAQPMIVTMTPVEGDSDSDYSMFTADKTIAEIAAAFNALTPVYFRGGLKGLDHIPLIYAMYDSDEEPAFGAALAGFAVAQVEGGEEGLTATSFIGQTIEDGEDVWMLVNWDSGRMAGLIGLVGTIGAGDSIAIDKTAQQLWDLCEKGRGFSLQLKDSGGNYLGEAVASITVMHDATGKYLVHMSTGGVYASAELNADDTVVLTKVTGE